MRVLGIRWPKFRPPTITAEYRIAAALLGGWTLLTWGLAELYEIWEIWPLSAGGALLIVGLAYFVAMILEERERDAQPRPDAR